MSVVTRFAPSPSGELHLGNARTALFNFLQAHRHGGRFLLRIEDTDAARSHERFVTALMEDLQWLGLTWEEPICRQSARGEVYASELAKLVDAGHAYPCFCSVAELEQARHTQLAAGRPPRYSGRCRDLSPVTAAERLAAGEPAALRFRVPGGQRVEFTDLVHGPQSVASDDIGDFVLRRTEGAPAFFFCNAVDDALQGVTQVLRGEDHLANTPRQLLVLAGLQLPAPAYGHMSLLLGAGGAPLSKREGAQSLRALRADGYLPSALVNLLFRLGHYSPLQQRMDLTEMAGAFELSHLQPAAAHLDPQQLTFWQKQAAHGLDAQQARAWLEPLLPAGMPAVQAGHLVAALQPNLVLPGEAREWIEIVLGAPPQLDEAQRAVVSGAGTGLFTAAAAAAREHGNDYARIVAAARDASGRKGVQLFQPLRLALTGRSEGPELKALLAAMPHGAAYERLRRFA